MKEKEKKTARVCHWMAKLMAIEKPKVYGDFNF